MRQKMEATKPSAEKVIKDIRRITRKQYGAEEKKRPLTMRVHRRHENVDDDLHDGCSCHPLPFSAKSACSAFAEIERS
ncbi:hypothetical protein [Mesorhizobium sp. A623]